MTNLQISVPSSVTVPASVMEGTHANPTWRDYYQDSEDQIRSAHQCLLDLEDFRDETLLSEYESCEGELRLNGDEGFDFKYLAGKTLAEVSKGVLLLIGFVSIDVERLCEELFEDLEIELNDALNDFTWTFQADGTLVRS